MFITIMMANFPDIVIDAYHINALYALYFIFYIFFAAIVIFGMVVGVFGANYQSFYEENLNKVEGKYPIFKREMKPIMDKKFLDSSDVDRVVGAIEF